LAKNFRGFQTLGGIPPKINELRPLEQGNNDQVDWIAAVDDFS